jgi:hypothetical protein
MWGTPQGMVYLATGHHDMRKSINGLALVVADTLELDPTGPHWFVFCNRGRDRLNNHTKRHWATISASFAPAWTRCANRAIACWKCCAGPLMAIRLRLPRSG